MAVIIVVIVGLAAAACANALYTRRGRDDSLERHERALNALRELNEHPHPEPAPIHEELPTDHVKILEERPQGSMAPRRRTRRAASARRTAARTRPREVASRPTAAQLPHTPSSGPSAPPPADEHPEPPRIAAPVTPIVFDDAFGDSVATTTLTPLSRSRTRSLPTVPRSVAVAAAVALVAVLIASVTAFVVTDRSSSPAHPRSAAPPAAVETTTTTPPPTVTTTLPKPNAQFTASASGNGTVTVAVPFTLTFNVTGPACWVSVDDASGHNVFTGTLKNGEQQQVPGSGPLTVRLGNTAAIQMSVNGAPLDMTGVAQTANVQFQPPA